jgi:hypothetical protein
MTIHTLLQSRVEAREKERAIELKIRKLRESLKREEGKEEKKSVAGKEGEREREKKEKKWKAHPFKEGEKAVWCCVSEFSATCTSFSAYFPCSLSLFVSHFSLSLFLFYLHSI